MSDLTTRVAHSREHSHWNWPGDLPTRSLPLINSDLRPTEALA